MSNKYETLSISEKKSKKHLEMKNILIQKSEEFWLKNKNLSSIEEETKESELLK